MGSHDLAHAIARTPAVPHKSPAEIQEFMKAPVYSDYPLEQSVSDRKTRNKKKAAIPQKGALPCRHVSQEKEA